MAFLEGEYQIGADEARDFLLGMPPVYVINDFLGEVQLRALYSISDAFVRITLGEGWSSAVAEAMSMALPVVTVAHPNVHEFLDDGAAYLVPLDTTDPYQYPFPEHEDNPRFGNPSQTELVSTLRTVRKESTTARTKGEMARLYATGIFGAESVSQHLLEHIGR
mmetsp:Transcript_35764/g.100660  ORF Transcript_35764/g.100660 Transcript_35764/m.100660 type:complete len:164 (-) Transcript_35764:440-931(-)